MIFFIIIISLFRNTIICMRYNIRKKKTRNSNQTFGRETVALVVIIVYFVKLIIFGSCAVTFLESTLNELFSKLKILFVLFMYLASFIIINLKLFVASFYTKNSYHSLAPTQIQSN